MLIRNFELRASRFCAEVMRDGERVKMQKRQYVQLVDSHSLFAADYRSALRR